MDGGMQGHSNGDGPYHRCQANKQFGRCSGDCDQGRRCDCTNKVEPDDLTIAYLAGFHDGQKAAMKAGKK